MSASNSAADIVRTLQGSPSPMHTIRLRGPWKSAWEGEYAIYRRTFHRPTGLSPSQELALQFQFTAEFISIEFRSTEFRADSLPILLNEHTLAPLADGLRLQADVTDTLLNFNRLEIRWPLDLFPRPSPDSDLPPAISELVDVSLVIAD